MRHLLLFPLLRLCAGCVCRRLRLRLWLPAFCGLAASLSLCAAQVPPVSLTFSAISIGDSIGELSYGSADGDRAIFIPNGSPSLPQRYQGDGSLFFYNGASPVSGVAAEPVGAVNLVGYSGKEVLLLFRKNRDNPQAYEIVVIDETAVSGAGKGSSWQVLNFTGAPVALKAGESQPLLINPGGAVVSSAPSTPARGAEAIQIAIRNEEGWERVYDSIWSRNPHVRTLVFLLPSGNDRGIRVSQIHLSANRQPRTAGTVSGAR